MKITAKEGFTAVKLIIVIAVIAVLAAILIPTLISILNNNNGSTADSELLKIIKLVQTELADDGVWEFTDKNDADITIKITETADFKLLAENADDLADALNSCPALDTYGSFSVDGSDLIYKIKNGDETASWVGIVGVVPEPSDTTPSGADPSDTTTSPPDPVDPEQPLPESEFTFDYPNDIAQSYIITGIKESAGELTEIALPSEYNGLPVTGIASGAFSDRAGLTKVIIPEGIKSIGSSAFSGCSDLESVTIPESVTSIGSKAFSNCSSLKSLTIPNGVKSIGSQAFSSSALESIMIPESVTEISMGAFAFCSDLKNVNILGGVELIYIQTFVGCSALESIHLSAGVKTIHESAFDGCTSLAEITVDEANAKFKSEDGNLYSKNGETLIKYAPGKTESSFALPESVTKIESSAFDYCVNLTEITVNEANTKFKSVDGNLYSKDGTTLAKYAVGKDAESFVIPETITSIGDYAFCGCQSLKSVTVPANVTEIGMGAFFGCESLTGVIFEITVGWQGRNPSPFAPSMLPFEVPTETLSNPASAAEYFKASDNYHFYYQADTETDPSV